MKWLTPKVRRYVYGILLAAFPVACFYWPELVPAAPLWLGLGMALLNVTDDGEPKPLHGDE